MTDLLAGSTIQALDTPPGTYAFDTTDQLNIASTTYIDGTPILAVTFVAPTTGRVWVTTGATIRSGTAGAERVHVTPEIRVSNSGGTVVAGPDVDLHGVYGGGVITQYVTHTRRVLITGLTPGQTYYAHLVHRSTNASNGDDIGGRELSVEPAT